MENKTSFDYIIVGGGTAGPVIASRLTENPSIKVLLIEAGEENTKEAIGYVNGAHRMWEEDTNWGYNSTPQEALNSRAIMQPRGKVMGGSASINVGSWSRGTAKNYEQWNIEGWDWETVLKWYRKIEDSDKGANAFRGGNGPMKLEYTPEGTPITQTFKEASIEVGIGATDDLNAENNEGFCVWQCIFRDGRRHNTIVNYLDGARNRPNLTILTSAFVSKVIIENTVATGVSYYKDGTNQTVKALNEVILCTGTYNTPKILMHSGIGPKDYLESLGIEVKLDLKGVGENLSDHLRIDVGVISPDNLGVSLRANDDDPKQLEEWRKTGYGPLSVAENTSAAFFKSSPNVPVADLELMFNINAPIQWGAPMPKNAGYHINVGLIQPKSKGTIRLASNNPKDAPLINPNYLGEEEDVKTYIKGIRKALEFPFTKALKDLTDISTINPSPEATDEQLTTYIKNTAESIYHPVGTSKMGNDHDPMAVVNNKLQVRGIKNLRVADASVIPSLISGHTMAPTILVAERAADFIKKTNKKMNFIELIITEDYRSMLTQLSEDVKLNLQTVGVAKGKAQGIELLKKQYQYLTDEIKEIKVFKQFEDDKHLVIEYDILLNNTFDLPVVVILVKDGNKYSSIRSYHSVYPITEGHIFRASIFNEEINLTEPAEVVNYFDGITIGSVEDTMDTLSFEDDVYFREPAGWRWNHKTKDGLRAHFQHFFADGGVPLKFHNYIFDKEKGTFAGEYTCNVWGSATFKAQAGISIYDINKETGKITGIRVYDNVDTSYIE